MVAILKRGFFFCVLLSSIWLPATVSAQDIQFTQFYAASLFLNPAFAGSSHFNRISAHQRVQWPGIQAKYITSMLAVDGFSDRYRSGFGLYTIFDYQGRNNMSSKEVQFQYTYEVPIKERLVFRPALQIGLVSRGLNDKRLVFPDQYNADGYVGGTQDLNFNLNILHADISSGFIVYSDRWWFGASAHHLNKPNVSFFESRVEKWPVRYAMVGGYRIVLEDGAPSAFDMEEISIVPSFHYKSQGKSDQLDIGLYFNYQFLVLGAWYRGIPVLKYYLPELHNNESMALLAGVKVDRWRAAYSYDFIVSKLIPARPVGAHELSISYTLSPKRKKTTNKRMPCPKF